MQERYTYIKRASKNRTPINRYMRSVGVFIFTAEMQSKKRKYRGKNLYKNANLTGREALNRKGEFL